jgi:hypothetical protein
MLAYRRTDPGHKMGGLILDVKGDLAPHAAALAADVDRAGDVVRVTPGGAVRWNPLHQPALLPRVLAARLLAVYQNLTGDTGTGDHAWIAQGVLRLLTHAIGLLREAQGYVTLAAVHRLLGDVGGGDPKAELSPQLSQHAEKARKKDMLLQQFAKFLYQRAQPIGPHGGDERKEHQPLAEQ